MNTLHTKLIPDLANIVLAYTAFDDHKKWDSGYTGLYLDHIDLDDENINGINQMTDVTVYTQLPKIKLPNLHTLKLDYYFDELINLSNCNLIRIIIDRYIRAIDLSSQINLQELSVSNYSYNLNLQNLSNLRRLDIINPIGTILNLTNCTSLRRLTIPIRITDDYDLSNCIQLESLTICAKYAYTLARNVLDLTSNHKLKRLRIKYGSRSWLIVDITNCTNLESITLENVGNNLNFANCHQLTCLDLGPNCKYLKDILHCPIKILKFTGYSDASSCIDLSTMLHLEELYLSKSINAPLILPSTLRVLHLSHSYTYPIELHEGLQVLHLGYSFNSVIKVPDSLIELHMGHRFDQPIDISKTKIQKLRFSGEFNQEIELPDTVTELHLGYEFKQPLKISHLTLTNCINSNKSRELEFL